MNLNLVMTLYIRVGCHLCENMSAQLAVLQESYGFSLNIVDVDTDNSLELRYGERVPVLVADNRELCHFFLNEGVIIEYFKSL